jgi:hypothetical protein
MTASGPPWLVIGVGVIVMVFVFLVVLAFDGPKWAAFGFSILAYLIVAARR